MTFPRAGCPDKSARMRVPDAPPALQTHEAKTSSQTYQKMRPQEQGWLKKPSLPGAQKHVPQVSGPGRSGSRPGAWGSSVTVVPPAQAGGEGCVQAVGGPREDGCRQAPEGEAADSPGARNEPHPGPCPWPDGWARAEGEVRQVPAFGFLRQEWATPETSRGHHPRALHAGRPASTLTWDGFLVAFGEELHGRGRPPGRLDQPLPLGVLSQRAQDGRVGGRQVGEVQLVVLLAARPLAVPAVRRLRALALRSRRLLGGRAWPGPRRLPLEEPIAAPGAPRLQRHPPRTLLHGPAAAAPEGPSGAWGTSGELPGRGVGSDPSHLRKIGLEPAIRSESGTGEPEECCVASFLWAGGSVGAAGRFYWPSLLASRRSLRPPPLPALRPVPWGPADAGRILSEPLPRQPCGLDWTL